LFHSFKSDRVVRNRPRVSIPRFGQEDLSPVKIDMVPAKTVLLTHPHSGMDRQQQMGKELRKAPFDGIPELNFFFIGRKEKPLNMEKVDAVRLEFAIQYRTRAWQTIEVDSGPAGVGTVDFVEPTIRGLSALGLRTPSPVRCHNLSEQVVQKLYACTGPYSQGRARDVLDILQIDLLGKLDVKAVRTAAKQVFAQRAIHGFPPLIQIPEEWKPELEVLARELDYPATSAGEIETRFRTFVDSVASGV
jgi:hypothetical protein